MLRLTAAIGGAVALAVVTVGMLLPNEQPGGVGGDPALAGGGAPLAAEQAGAAGANGGNPAAAVEAATPLAVGTAALDSSAALSGSCTDGDQRNYQILVTNNTADEASYEAVLLLDDVAYLPPQPPATLIAPGGTYTFVFPVAEVEHQNASGEVIKDVTTAVPVTPAALPDVCDSPPPSTTTPPGTTTTTPPVTTTTTPPVTSSSTTTTTSSGATTTTSSGATTTSTSPGATTTRPSTTTTTTPAGLQSVGGADRNTGNLAYTGLSLGGLLLLGGGLIGGGMLLRRRNAPAVTGEDEDEDGPSSGFVRPRL